MFRIKICGITNVEDAVAAVDAGADAIGLNFYEKSPRCVTIFEAKSIVDEVEDPAYSQPRSTGVFVNAEIDTIRRIVNEIGISNIQLHGDESPDYLVEIPKIARRTARIGGRDILSTHRCNVIRARRFDDRGVSAIASDINACEVAGRRPAAVLIDAFTPGRYGGTGETVSWVGLVDHRKWLGDTPLILAGGLTPDNVAEAIRIVRPAAVDVASGVESSPGKKDPHKVRDFVAAAQAAFESLES